MNQILNGMDYCLDWKPEEGEWSARQVFYHLVDTPPAGLHSTASAILRGEIQNLTFLDGIVDVTPERQNTDLSQILEEMEAILTGIEEVISATSDTDLEGKTVSVLFPARNANEVRSVGTLIERSLGYHWRDHLGQLAALREALGLG